MKKKGGFTGQLGFVFTAAGSAVGVGNLWRHGHSRTYRRSGLFHPGRICGADFLHLCPGIHYSKFHGDLSLGEKEDYGNPFGDLPCVWISWIISAIVS